MALSKKDKLKILNDLKILARLMGKMQKLGDRIIRHMQICVIIKQKGG